ncbi:flagellar motor switch phosphatase FliY [Allobacillus sp. GCM10007491]|uniref:Flagellar motor switch phosphatase FliY n=1 Tax=Allobacillus saliphilus TaxID=2912308 RepID=A0A941CS67_9BACI|nr:flagellar motor switch phosphatase FliY [Allobacillus saliphilus]MBR7552898.1 flagellar motor switch phosphatase FliY [Allobacillus saliphilus]
MDNHKSDMLTQEEIDALLNGDSSDDQTDERFDQQNQQSTESMNESKPSLEDVLTSMEVDAIGELGNISFGSSATTLSTLLNHKVEITTPVVTAVHVDQLAGEFPIPHVAVSVDYTSGFTGSNLLVIKHEDAAVIADLMLGGDGSSPSSDLDELHLSAIQEAMNQMMGSAATSMSSIFDEQVDISPPKPIMLDVMTGDGLEYLPDEPVLIKVSFQLKVENLIDSSIMQLLPIQFVKDSVERLLNGSSKEKEESNQQTFEKEEGEKAVKNYSEEEPEPNQHTNDSSYQKPFINNVESAQFSEFGSSEKSNPTERRNLDLLMDIPLNVSVELGRTRKPIRDILDLSTGSIVELDKLAGEPVDILVNSKLIAKGEVVVIEENFGVRVTDILSQAERIQKLR